MALQVFTAGQTLTAAQMTTLQASTYNYPLSTISASTYTILSSDAGKLLLFTNNATPVGVTFPASLGMAVGDTVEIVHGGTGTLSLIADAGVTLNSEGSLLTLETRYARVAVVKTASNVFLVSWMTAITAAEITTGSVTSDKIADGAIMNVDINASAAIAHSKLANATAGQVLLGTTTTGVVTATTISGDVTINGAGVATIAANSVALGTDTTGDYVATITGGTGVTSSAATTGEGTTHSLSIGQAVGTTDNVTFAGVTADSVRLGVTAAGEIDTSSGNLTIDSAGGTTTIDDNVTITGNLTVNGSSVTSQNTSQGYATTVTSAGTLTLTSTSTYLQYFTGSTTHTVVLPVTSTLQQGTGYEFHNNSTGVITVNSSGGNLVTTVQPAQTMRITCILVTGTTAASWDADVTGGTSSTGTGALAFATSPTLTTPTLGVATATSVNGTTIPSSKTLVVTTDKLSVLAATTSAELAGVISDETGSGALVFANSPTFTGTVTGNPTAGTISTGASGFGYMGLPQNASTTGTYPVVAADAGTHIYSSATRTVTIPANATIAMPIGSTLVFIAGSGATVTIAITSDTMYLAGPGTTGSRTLAPFGMATAVKITATSWIISGNGLT